ncbi:MGMT family protein [Rubrivirga marina]|uniref:MGMT family protein n=1 Tax=Rubrivirga marina TaxID=1196024 RepID=UPI002481CD10|nr:MGMT family protein [Rubrivirga marina]
MPHATLDTPLGPLRLVSDGEALTAASFDPVRLDAEADGPEGADAILDAARRQLAAYFDGEPVAFDVPVRPGGTPFQERVWAALREIPHGATLSYGADGRRRSGCPEPRRPSARRTGRTRWP